MKIYPFSFFKIKSIFGDQIHFIHYLLIKRIKMKKSIMAIIATVAVLASCTKTTYDSSILGSWEKSETTLLNACQSDVQPSFYNNLEFNKGGKASIDGYKTKFTYNGSMVRFTLENDSTVNYMYRFEDEDLHIYTKENGCRYVIEYTRTR